ncbi:MAG: HD domain-containing protein [Oligoflexia bacterium]|nr:HD domain-containing protein [Oligoflexia bacterium]
MDQARLEPKVQKKLEQLRSKPIIARILKELELHLPKSLYYHGLKHTEDVMHQAVLYAVYDDLSEREIELLAIAAAYHDSGFLKSLVDNETLGAKMARDAMRESGAYTEAEIELIAKMIVDTAVVHEPPERKQIPSSFLSGYLLDADLSNFGREDFFDRLEEVRLEMGANKGQFLNTTLQLISSHDWHSAAAKALREEQKRRNLRNLKSWVIKYQL